MTLQDFENQIDSNILDRGRYYFENEKVEFLEETKKGHWNANVLGTEDYITSIQLGNKNTIKNCSCDCPYDGYLCKHIVAVLYAIAEIKMDMKEATLSKESLKKSKKLPFDTLLLKIELKEYQDFIKELSGVDKNFKDKFELYFSQKDDHFDLEKKYLDVIKKTVQKNTSRGFIDYTATRLLSKEFNTYLAQAKQYFLKKNYRDSFILYKIVMKEAMKVLEYCDDSNGAIGDVVSEAIEEIGSFMKAPVSFEFKEQITDFLTEELQKKIYFEYGDFGYDLTETYAEFCLEINRIDAITTFLDNKIELAKNNHYDKKFFIQTKISVLNQISKTDEAEILIQENLEIPEIRTLEVEKYVKINDYVRAKKIIAEGIKIAETINHSGTVNQWKLKLLEIAVLEKDIKTQRILSLYFAFDSGLNGSFYKQWKNTYSSSEWSLIIEEKISEITKKVTSNTKGNSFSNEDWLNSNLLYSLGPIFVQEKFWNRLLALVQKQTKLSTVLVYYPNLKKEYPDELLKVLIPLLETEGDRCDGRSQYKDLADKIKAILKDFPNEKTRILGVAQKLKDKYPRRPAMQEELNELFQK